MDNEEEKAIYWEQRSRLYEARYKKLLEMMTRAMRSFPLDMAVVAQVRIEFKEFLERTKNEEDELFWLQ